ncbi:hypothetical protein PISL3812_01601 [Talaromyces islandicus]|uniref:Uncharacterized protein n=1 Tax=Talaromyces islandicus TaxID=28573 RepID=A0A0U1LMJ7_TALIS|nr:hypothetical protein PISL3812_01601 [Talaromyces islandicus]
MKYEIQDLLALRRNAAIDIGRFTVHAIENHLLGRGCSAPNTDRGRASSGGSGRAAQHHMTSSEDSFQYPIRQPRSAPQNNLAEADSGFAKFLKEHTSPRHQRVTAGGRVVLVDGEVPIPELKPPLKKSKEDNPKKTDADTTASIRTQGNSGSEKIMSSSRTSSNGNGLPDQPFSSLGQEKVRPGETGPYLGNGNQEPMPAVAASYPLLQQWQVPLLASDPYRQHQVSLSSGAYPQPVLQLARAGQDSVAMPINAGLYQSLQASTAAWYPCGAPPFVTQGHIVQPVPPQATPLLTTTFPSTSKQPGVVSTGNINSYPISPAIAGTTSLPSYTPESNTQRSLQDVIKELQGLSSQLSSLDRYMAINTFEMDPETKNNLVEQRKGLVKDLDMTRRYKEHLESTVKAMPGVPDPLAGWRSQQTTELANGIGLQWNPWSSYVTASDQSGDHSSFTLPPPQGTIPNTFAVSIPQLGYLASFPGVNSWSEYQNPVQLPQVDQQGSCEYQFYVPVDKPATTSQPNTGSQQSAGTTRTKPSWSSSEVGELHRQIESAARRGEPVEELFKRLAKLTEQHAVRRGKQNTLASTERQPPASTTGNSQVKSHSPLHPGNVGTSSGTSSVSKSYPSTPASKKGPATTAPKSRRGQESSTGQFAGVAAGNQESEAVGGKYGFTGPRHTRDGRLKSLVARSKGRKEGGGMAEKASVACAPWESHGNKNLIGMKACAPVISRVNAHGFLPSSDGTSDESHAFGDYPAFLLDLQDERDFLQKDGAAPTRPWYQKAPRQSPNRVEVRRFFLRVAEEEQQMIYKYRMRYPVKGETRWNE